LISAQAQRKSREPDSHEVAIRREQKAIIAMKGRLCSVEPPLNQRFYNACIAARFATDIWPLSV
jgi:hypothetical protein